MSALIPNQSRRELRGAPSLTAAIVAIVLFVAAGVTICVVADRFNQSVIDGAKAKIEQRR